MKCVIHAGMHKTGSTSIQTALATMSDDEYQYLELDSPNHSVALKTIFGKAATPHPALLQRGLTQSEISNYRKKWLGVFYSQIKSTTKNIIISGEDLSFSGSEDVLKNLSDVLQQYFEEIEVIVYVRAPIGYTQSAFQEFIKNGGTAFDLERQFPRYKERFYQLEKVFGSESVKYVHFSRDSLIGGDAVSDFFARLGLEDQLDTPILDNKSLSLDAISILYKYRKEEKSLRSCGFELPQNSSLIKFLKRISGTKLTFSGELMEPLVNKYSDDIAWIEGRLGKRLQDDLESDGEIRSEADLVENSKSQIDLVIDLYKNLPNNDVMEKTAFSVLAALRADIPCNDQDRKVVSHKFSPYFPDEVESAVIESGIEKHVVLRELASSLSRLGARESALKILNSALLIHPHGLGLQRLKNDIEHKIDEMS